MLSKTTDTLHKPRPVSGQQMHSGAGSIVLIDAHVHFHPCFEPEAFLQAAYENLRSQAAKVNPEAAFVGGLLLTEGPSENGFERLRDCLEHHGADGSAALGPWHVHATDECDSFHLISQEGARMVVVAGRQIATQERLEVLAIGTLSHFEERQPIQTTIREVSDAGALPIIPWGFGKWIGERGRLMRQLLQDDELPRFFLSDNANRPAVLRRSSLFDRAEERGVLDCPGSDPLPFPREFRRPGTAGFVLDVSLSDATPAREIKDELTRRTGPLKTFLEKESVSRFVRNQLAMQYRKVTNRS